MADPVPLRKVEFEPDQNAVKILEEVLESVKKGDVFAFALVTLDKDNQVGSACHKPLDVRYTTLIGGVRWLEHKVIKEAGW